MKFMVQIASFGSATMVSLRKKLFSLPSPIWASFVGVVVGLAFIGPKNLWFTNTQWLTNTSLNDDARTSQQIWNFFRKSPLVQWPPTKLSTYLDGAEILIPSANNLFSIPLKYLTFFIPTEFQYFGFWLVLCFALQGYFAGKLLGIWIDDLTWVIVSASLFIISPIFLHRISMMGHFELGSHWLLLAATYNYFAERHSKYGWPILLASSLLSNVYIFIMVFAIFLAFIAKDFSLKRESLIRAIKFAIFSVGGVVLVFFVLGYNQYSGSAKGTGFFRTNIGAFINPKIVNGGIEWNSASLLIGKVGFISSRPFAAFEGEGFNFLGLATFVLFPLSCLYLVRNFREINWRRHIPIISMVLGMLLFAFSNKLVFVRREFEYPVPSVYHDFRSILRSATRFAWPFSYLILLYGILALRKTFKTFAGISILTLLLFVQSVDSLNFFNDVRRPFTDNNQIALHQSSRWQEIGAEAKSLRLVPTFDFTSDDRPLGSEYWLEDGEWFRLIEFAATHDLKINFGYVARPIPEYVEQTNESLYANIEKNIFERDAIYIFADRSLWQKAINSLPSYASSKIIDYRYLIITN